MVATSCGTGPVLAGGDETALVTVVDEAGRGVPGAVVALPTGTFVTDDEGRAEVTVAGPVAGTVSASQKLTEPVVVAPGDRSRVRMWSRQGPDGSVRRALQFGGDVMLGRRYLDPAREGTARVVTGDGGESARAVTEDLAPLLAAADLSSVNLETVVGDPPPSAMLTGKRFTLRSPPETVAMLTSMGVDVAVLGNNHSYDWGEAGLAATTGLLSEAGIAFTGAGTDVDAGRVPAVVDVPGGPVTVLSYSTVNGDWLNDHLAVSGEPVPVPVAPEEAWQYRPRMFGYGVPGDPAYLARAPRLPGDVWRWFSDLEPRLGEEEAAGVWAALTAGGAFPELQDWVARRGHGGAVPFDRDLVAADIAAADGLVVVELHSGLQFSETGSGFMRRAARAAIDAGADLVVAHHPHILQGFEWYQGKLIAHSLGNLVFDQDLMVTFPSAVLRVVFAGDRLLEARLIPLVLDDYRPVPVSGEAATRVYSIANAAALVPGVSTRLADDTIGVVPADTGVTAVVGADGRIGPIPARRRVTVRSDTAGVIDLAPGSIVLDVTETVDVGRDLLGWGWFDDTEADGEPRAAALWSTETAADVEVVDTEDGSALRLYANRRGTARIRPVGRVPLVEHRLFTADGEPLDEAPRYTIRLRARAPIDLRLTVRIDAYIVDDADPLRRPSSQLVRSTRLAVPVSAGPDYRTYDVEIPEAAITSTRGRADAVMFYLGAEAPRAAAVTVDDLRFLEWRPFRGVAVADALATPHPEMSVGVVVAGP